jgi:anti-sigma factor RsiW
MKKHEAFDSLHERARWLIDREQIEGLEPDDRRWLMEHLATCESCASRSATTEATLRAMKSISVPIPPGLAASTSICVRERAVQLRHGRARNLALITGCAISWMAGVASAPLVWRFCEWVGTTLALPRIVWELGFLSWWLVPAASAGLVILWVNARAESEEFNGRLESGSRASGR